MFIPYSTYRIQFNKDFTFDHFNGIVDYLYDLGISTIYASPILKSTKGSVHGYDVTDPYIIDPEIGSLDELKQLAQRLKKKGMTWLQDIVPNHMAFDVSNSRLMDVLERGPLSPYYNYFDIDWNHPSPSLNGKLLVPFLGDDLDSCIANKQLRLNFTQSGFVIEYFDARYPVSIVAYDQLFSILSSSAGKKLKSEWEQFKAGAASRADLKTWQKVKSSWINSISRTEENNIRKILTEVETDSQKLWEILQRQHYVLSHWKRTEKEINYRRFFTVNQLICLRMEDENVFNEYHSFLRTLYKENIIQGFRIDHIDGLKDPFVYIQRLRAMFGDNCYIIAEKILEAKETIPLSWPLQGTSGYEFLAYVNQLFTDRKGARKLVEYYEKLVPQLPGYKQIVDENKRMILDNYMSGEWDNLTNYFYNLNLAGSFDRANIKQAIGAVLVSLPVYRIYPDDLPLVGNDLVIMAEAIQKAKHLSPSCVSALNYFNELLVSPPQDQKSKMLDFLKRMMQYAGPLTAKGVEDTTFYVYNPLISHDEVGDSPSSMGISIKDFHARMVIRQQTTPLSLNTTATHDTKRGEDVRIRLNVLSEIPDQWIDAVERWFDMNRDAHTILNGHPAPTVNDEYFVYQSIVGGFPEDLKPSETWVNRLQEYLVKALREAKINTSWESPDDAYENACKEFIDKIIYHNQDFINDVIQFLKVILPYANANAIGQMLIKITAPGVPDVYQGCEQWDLSYVDPDNRRAVDYDIRRTFLDQIREKEECAPTDLFSYLHEHREQGVEKFFVGRRALRFRRDHNKIFTHGEYLPLQVSGSHPVACAYARCYNDECVLIVVPVALAGKNGWSGESISVPVRLSGQWTNIFTEKVVDINEQVSLREILSEFPVGFLTAKISSQ